MKKTKTGDKLREVERALGQAVTLGDSSNACDSAKLLSTGSTLLNLACTDDWRGGFAPGRYYYLVGDSASGKTFLAMTCFAEAAISQAFDKHRLIYDNVEDGCQIDLERLFNRRVAERLEPPAVGDDGPVYSETIEQFYYHLDDAVKAAEKTGNPFVYVLDSMDALSSESESDKFEENKQAYRRGREGKGSYGDGKAKRNSEGLRRALAGIRRTGSVLLIVSQTRDNIGFGFEKKTRSGGHALRFYATIEIWSSIVKTLKVPVRSKNRPVGVKVGLRVKKNRVTGKLHEVYVDIYPSVGIDDVGSCVDYLVDEGWWPKIGKAIDAKEMNLVLSRDRLIDRIERDGLYDRLREITAECWNSVEQETRIERRNRYALGSD